MVPKHTTGNFDPVPRDSLSRPASAKDAPEFLDDAHRYRSASAFRTGADTYDFVRPGYPDEVVDLVAGRRTVLDVGAGTGKLTSRLIESGHEVLASDPSPDMVRVLARLGVPVWRATAEVTSLADASVDAVTCAQAWHWVDAAAACRELDRVVRPGGRVVLVWNNLDVSHPWILRLARIMHSGDIQRPGFLPEVHDPWRITFELRTGWVQHLRTGEVHQLMQTRSYWLRSPQKIRERMTRNLDWYLFERLGFQEGQLLPIPYRTDAFVLERSIPHSPTTGNLQAPGFS
ncbi:class I SAM-dependent methyltransferase [Corynebacterium marinum]|uniref:SAM-dependent methyltransferase n=1 Tax=Corynebacterium marinum DSM 44953 TaxID=1224162 RepID=A0A0B6TRB4_9CORY|nr:SAM-dependent methyltransferase [Corynebacterium marinum DSM 44953]GGO21372.1 SAM-dependent methyltransferase [Corynebacterium marinum]